MFIIICININIIIIYFDLSTDPDKTHRLRGMLEYLLRNSSSSEDWCRNENYWVGKMAGGEGGDRVVSGWDSDYERMKEFCDDLMRKVEQVQKVLLELKQKYDG